MFWTWPLFPPQKLHLQLTCFLHIKECIKWALATGSSRCRWDMRFLSETGTAIVFYLRSLAALVARHLGTLVVCPQGHGRTS
jgi:hypothetical protein